MICGALTGGVFKSTLGILPVFSLNDFVFNIIIKNSAVLGLFLVGLVLDALLMLLIT